MMSKLSKEKRGIVSFVAVVLMFGILFVWLFTMQAQDNPRTMAFATGGNPTPTPMLRFGADVGIYWVNGTPGPLTDRMSRIATDQLPVVRYFFEGNAYINTFLSSAYTNSRKVSIVFKVEEYYYRNSISATQFASDVQSALTTAQAYITGDYAGTVISVELGNEEDNHNGTRPIFNNSASDLEPYSFWGAGVNFSEYYIKAYNAIKNNWPNLTIISPNISLQESLSKPSKASFPNIGQEGQAFIHGFIAGATSHAEGGQNKLPNIIAIHGYSAYRQPENYEDSTDGTQYWIKRITKLREICATHSYYPEFANTEYGFSHTSGKSWAPTNSDVRVQAIYYMRRDLMDASMRSSLQSKNWKYSLYWQHAFNDYGDDNTAFTSWFTDGVAGTSRTIRKVGQNLHQNVSGMPHLFGSYQIWIEAKSEQIIGNKHKLTCGWIDEAGQKWGAIWIYDINPTSEWDDFTDYYVENSVDFVINSDTAPSSASLYKFSFSSPYSYDNTTFADLSTTVNRQSNGTGSYKYTLSNIVDENPTFLKFSSN